MKPVFLLSMRPHVLAERADSFMTDTDSDHSVADWTSTRVSLHRFQAFTARYVYTLIVYQGVRAIPDCLGTRGKPS